MLISKTLQDLRIAVLDVVTNKAKYTMNKDLNGGFGTADTYSDSIFAKIVGKIKKKSICINLYIYIIY